MIKFFRHIRQRLVKENRTSKYLLYAIGEIVLVVIGILIALQINNWNEQSKTEQSAKEQLKLLTQNVSDDIQKLKELNQSITAKISAGELLSHQFQEIKPYDRLTTNYLVEILFEQNFYNDRTAYDKLILSGEYSVFPTELQNQISEYYSLLDRVKEREEISNTFIKNEIEPHYFNTYSKYIRKGSNLHPLVVNYYKNDKRQPISLDVEQIKNDSKMEGLNFGSLYQSRTQQEFYEKAIEKGNLIKKLIDNYLKTNVKI
ncbi:DUF6090 family protein [Winogradskyella ouciana]|uniref:Uncharacterized protein n=1 Tax=Winogradskyella ouciana TaxID=2608631 RepID=A0A7K1GFR7_9FLAO|nr:DUF6090 family protein [Winogradskyella ouciana]MTE27865.1 hypothetical protein [Winogradskyella ouciana]